MSKEGVIQGSVGYYLLMAIKKKKLELKILFRYQNYHHCHKGLKKHQDNQDI